VRLHRHRASFEITVAALRIRCMRVLFAFLILVFPFVAHAGSNEDTSAARTAL
jgi:hypothetical protein